MPLLGMRYTEHELHSIAGQVPASTRCPRAAASAPAATTRSSSAATSRISSQSGASEVRLLAVPARAAPDVRSRWRLAP